MTRTLIRIERGYDVSYFLFISRLQKYYSTIFIWKMVWKMLVWIFNASLCSFTYRCKVNIKEATSIIEIGYSITIIKGEYGLYTGSYSFKKNNESDSLSCVLNVITICFKIFFIINLITFPHTFFAVRVNFLF